MTRLAVFGTGRIGGGVAAMVTALHLADEIVLHDTNKALLEAQRLDLIHTGTPVRISTDIREMKDADIAVCTAGLPRNPAVKTRAHLLDVNLPAAADCARTLRDFSGILITVSNPADIISYYLWKATGLAREQVIGFGGQLDSARFSCELASRGFYSPGTILGEHGEHQVPVFSTLASPVPGNDRDEILATLRGASMEIIKGKGATEYAPVWHITRLISTIVQDQKMVLPCSCVLDGEYEYANCSLGVPAIIGKDGVNRIEEWNLDSWEKSLMDTASSFTTDLCRRFTGAVSP